VARVGRVLTNDVMLGEEMTELLEEVRAGETRPEANPAPFTDDARVLTRSCGERNVLRSLSP